MQIGPKNVAGFTLLEMLVVTAIIATMSMILFFNFRSASGNATARHQVSSLVTSDIRRAQTMTTSSTRFNGNITCGFGIHYIDSASYIIYAGSDGGSSCTSTDKNYQDGIDLVVQTIQITNPNFFFKSDFSDIFFEPPDPKTYIDNQSALDDPPTTIPVCGFDEACTNLIIRTSGTIDVTES